MILKLKQTPGIYLAGFMGSGKSIIGRALADELGWTFFDLDEEIERESGETIANLFDKRGEPAFRALESEVLKKRVQNVRTGRPQVVSLGGGTLTIPANFELISKNGIVIWLDVPFEVVAARVGTDPARPLARDPKKFRELFDARQESYARADYRIDCGEDPPAVIVGRILALPLFVP